MCAVVIPCAAALLLFPGCEVDSAASRIDITPNSASLYMHQSVTLTAHGGYNYEWSLATEGWGVLNTRRGNEVTYTSWYEPATGSTPSVQIVRVLSRFSNNTSETNSAGSNSFVNTSEAYITHLPPAAQ